MKTVFMFSGQGSQYFQMGKALFQSDPCFRAEMQGLDGVVRRLAGASVIDTIYADANRMGMSFDRTLLSHPAIVMVEYALAKTLIEGGRAPDIVLGASLGSFTAAVLAGAISIEDALELAVAHARALEQDCAAGAMIAILDDPALAHEPFLAASCELAAVNFSSHFVISVPGTAMAAVEQELSRRDIAFQRLPVSFAFHSRWMDGARSSFEKTASALALGPLQRPLLCCDQAGFPDRLLPDYFWNVTRRPIRFAEAIAELESMGAHRYIDVGPSGTLSGFLKYILPPNSPSEYHTILTPYGHDAAQLERLQRAR